MPPPEAPLVAAAWDKWQACLAELQAELLATAPDAVAAAESAMYLARLSAATLERVFSPGLRTEAGLYYSGLRLAGANPDYRMAQAVIDPTARYELSGQMNDAQRIGVGLYRPTAGGGLDLEGYLQVGRAPAPPLGPQGKFSLQIGPVGAHLLTRPGAIVLMVRELHRRPNERMALLRLRRVDAASASPLAEAPSAEVVAAQLRAAAQQVATLVRHFLPWSASFAAQVNSLAPLDEALDRAMRGDPDTHYVSGSFDLQPGEVLAITWPHVACDYWAIQATNHWLEPIAGANLNDATAQTDADGQIQVFIAARPVAAPNRLLTQGRLRGGLLFRTVGAAGVVVPRAQVVRPHGVPGMV